MGCNYESSPKKSQKIILDNLKLDKGIQNDSGFIYLKVIYLQKLQTWLSFLATVWSKCEHIWHITHLNIFLCGCLEKTFHHKNACCIYQVWFIPHRWYLDWYPPRCSQNEGHNQICSGEYTEVLFLLGLQNNLKRLFHFFNNIN